MKTNKTGGLGKGLSALLSESAETYSSLEPQQGMQELAVTLLKANPAQPRHYFNEEALAELAASIKTNGILQPIVVRPVETGGYQVVAGERRWRAAQMAGLAYVPCLIRVLTDAETMEIALLENIQRQDLTPIEEAKGYQELKERFAHTQEDLAKVVHKSRSHIANTLRLLQLPDSVQHHLEQNHISAGHGKILVGQPDAEFLAARVATERWSVRQLEDYLQRRHLKKENSTPQSRPRRLPELLHLEQQLQEKYGVEVRITARGQEGKLSLHYRTTAELGRLAESLLS